MNYCPECGHVTDIIGTTDDVATEHIKHKCFGCGKTWEETTSKETGDILHVSPVEEGGE